MPNAWDKFFGGQWEKNKKIDPLTHRGLELVVKQDSHNIGVMDKGISEMFGGDGSTVIGDEARKVQKDPKRGIGRAALVAGGVFGAMYGAPAAAGGGAGGAGAGAGGGAAAGSGGGYAAATNPALIESAVGTACYGASSAGPGGASAAGLGGSDWMRLGQQVQGMGDDRGGGSGDDDITEVDLAALLAAEAQRQRENEVIARSSKKAKTPGARGLEMMRDHPIDRTGRDVAAIQELKRQVDEAKKKLARLQAKRKGH